MAEETDVLSPSRIARLLELGCAYNVPISVTSEFRNRTHRYKSRMLDIRQAPDASAVIVDQPTADGPAAALKPNAAILVFFAVDENRFLFESCVLRKTTFDLRNEKTISALEIAYPNALRNGQRRANYRVSVPLGISVVVDCAVLENETEGFQDRVESWDFPSDRCLAGRILNISAGGMLVSLEQVARNLVNRETKLGLKFSLAGNETSLRLKGIIIRIEEKTSAQDARVAVQFIDTEEEFECRLAINRLYRYVAERQRELIRLGKA